MDESPLPLLGPLSVSRAQFGRVLEEYGSPCRDGPDAYYDVLVESGINPAVGLAFFVHESACGTRGKATVTQNWGNLREGRGKDWEIPPPYEGFARFATWEDGLRAWCWWLTEGPNYVKAGRDTVEAIVPVYAPGADNNDVQAYVDTVRRLVATWQEGQAAQEGEEQPDMPNMDLAFVDRDIPLDASTPVPPPPRPIKGVVLHHTAGSALPFPARSGSWHWIVDKAGTIYRDVSEENCAHHVLAADRWRPPWVVPSAVAVSDVNYCTIGIEIVYAPQNDETPNEAQHSALRRLLVSIYGRHGRLPVVGHGQLQLDKWETEPHALDWTKAGLGPLGPDGRWREAADNLDNPPPIVSPVPDVTGVAGEAETEHIMTDDEAMEVGKALWVNAPFDAGFAICRAWARALTRGQYWGTPQSTELDVPNGKKVQRFEFGLAVWLGGAEVRFAFARPL